MDDDNPVKTPLYKPNADEWATHGVDVERGRLLSGLDTLMQMDVTIQFRSPGNEDSASISHIEKFSFIQFNSRGILLLLPIRLIWEQFVSEFRMVTIVDRMH